MATPETLREKGLSFGTRAQLVTGINSATGAAAHIEAPTHTEAKTNVRECAVIGVIKNGILLGW